MGEGALCPHINHWTPNASEVHRTREAAEESLAKWQAHFDEVRYGY